MSERYANAMKLLGFSDGDIEKIDLEGLLSPVGKLLLVSNTNYLSWIESLEQAKIPTDDQTRSALSDPIVFWLLLSNLYVLVEDLGLTVNAKMAWSLAPPLKAQTVRRKLELAVNAGLINVMAGTDRRSDRLVPSSLGIQMVRKQCDAWVRMYDGLFGEVSEYLSQSAPQKTGNGHR